MKKFKIESIAASDISRYRYLKKFSLSKVDSDTGTLTNTLEVTLIDEPEEGAPEISFTFFGVTDLKIRDLSCWLTSSIQISDISSHQLEGANFRVEDAEREWFSLNCEDVAVRSQTAPKSEGMHLAATGTHGR